jgi:hypothetical protein
MPLNIKDFQGEIRGLGIQRTNRFLTNIGVPPSMDVSGNLMSFLKQPTNTSGKPTTILGKLADAAGSLTSIAESRQLALRCTNAVFPGMNLMVKDNIMRYGRGPVDKTAHNVLFSDIHCMFVVDAKGILQDYFYKWMQSIVNSDSSDSMNRPSHGALPYEVTFKDHYVTNMTITQLNERNDGVLECRAHKVFPIAIGDIQLGWDQNDQIVMLPVTFSYRDHKIVKLENLNLGSVGDKLKGLL